MRCMAVAFYKERNKKHTERIHHTFTILCALHTVRIELVWYLEHILAHSHTRAKSREKEWNGGSEKHE